MNNFKANLSFCYRTFVTSFKLLLANSLKLEVTHMQEKQGLLVKELNVVVIHFQRLFYSLLKSYAWIQVFQKCN